MKSKVFGCLLIFCLWTLDAQARPPSDVDLKYNGGSQTLVVEVSHVTKNPRDHHIRRILVYKNDEEPLNFYYTTQKSSRTFDVEIPLELKSGDDVRVKVICNEAGYKEANLSIP